MPKTFKPCWYCQESDRPNHKVRFEDKIFHKACLRQYQRMEMFKNSPKDSDYFRRSNSLEKKDFEAKTGEKLAKNERVGFAKIILQIDAYFKKIDEQGKRKQSAKTKI